MACTDHGKCFFVVVSGASWSESSSSKRLGPARPDIGTYFCWTAIESRGLEVEPEEWGASVRRGFIRGGGGVTRSRTHVQVM